MPKRATTTRFVVSDAVLHAFEIKDRAHHDRIEDLPADGWCAQPPDGRGREIPAIVAHVHNVGMMWLKAAAHGSEIPGQLNRRKEPPAQAKKGSEPSRAALRGVRRKALEINRDVRGFKPDLAAFFGCLVAHDGHHREHIATLARQVCHPVPPQPTFGTWEWGAR
jgi:hypothetical protein